MVMRMGILLALGLTLGSTVADAKTSIAVLYSHPNLFSEVHREIARRFMDKNPDIEVTLRAPVEDYDKLTQQALRDAATGQSADVQFHGYDRLEIISQRAVSTDLGPLIANDADFAQQGIDGRVLKLGASAGKQVGLPFALSTQIVYYNEDLLTKAGWDLNRHLDSWDAILAAGKSVSALGGNVAGLYVDTATGTFTWQSLIMSHGGRIVSDDETKAVFGDRIGLQAMELVRRFRTESEMPDMSMAQARQAFASGSLGVLVSTTAWAKGLSRDIGKSFTFKTGAFPMASADGRLPAGGNAVVVAARDPDRLAAAWKYAKFTTGAEAITLLVRATGYMPSNRIASDSSAFLGDYYRDNPQLAAGVSQLDRVAPWYAFKGMNGLKIGDITRTTLQQVYTLQKEPAAALAELTAEVQSLMEAKQ
jgi:multiple sugar transport system substrate-binding protein